MSAQQDDSATQKRQILERAASEGIRFVNLQFTDIMGLVKTVSIPIHKLEDAIDHGLWFDGSSVEGFARIHESDMYLQPDLSTFNTIPVTGYRSAPIASDEASAASSAALLPRRLSTFASQPDCMTRQFTVVP